MNWKAFLQALGFAAVAGALQVVAGGEKINGTAVAAGAAAGVLGLLLKSPLVKPTEPPALPGAGDPAPAPNPAPATPQS